MVKAQGNFPGGDSMCTMAATLVCFALVCEEHLCMEEDDAEVQRQITRLLQCAADMHVQAGGGRQLHVQEVLDFMHLRSGVPKSNSGVSKSQTGSGNFQQPDSGQYSMVECQGIVRGTPADMHCDQEALFVGDLQNMIRRHMLDGSGHIEAAAAVVTCQQHSTCLYIGRSAAEEGAEGRLAKKSRGVEFDSYTGRFRDAVLQGGTVDQMAADAFKRFYSSRSTKSGSALLDSEYTALVFRRHRCAKSGW